MSKRSFIGGIVVGVVIAFTALLYVGSHAHAADETDDEDDPVLVTKGKLRSLNRELAKLRQATEGIQNSTQCLSWGS